eukprot:1157521-Pelagomonas_calceolata.AAC.4
MMMMVSDDALTTSACWLARPSSNPLPWPNPLRGPPPVWPVDRPCGLPPAVEDSTSTCRIQICRYAA